MNQSRSTFALYIISILFYLPSSAAEQLDFAVDNYCPYYCKSENSSTNDFAKKPGFVIEILESAFKDQGYSINYTFLPWERGLLEVEKGNFNGIIVSSKYNAYGLIIPDIEQGRSRGCFFAHADKKWRYTDNQSLQNIRLGLIKSYDYGEPFNSYINDKNNKTNIYFLVGNRPLHRLLDMIQGKRFDATLDDVNVISHILKENKK